jgi:hypothetical protein
MDKYKALLDKYFNPDNEMDHDDLWNEYRKLKAKEKK